MSDGRLKFRDAQSLMDGEVYVLPEEKLSAAFEDLRDKFETLLDILDTDNATFDFLTNILFEMSDDPHLADIFVGHTIGWVASKRPGTNVDAFFKSACVYIDDLNQLEKAEAVRIERSRLRRMNQPRSGKRELNV